MTEPEIPEFGPHADVGDDLIRGDGTPNPSDTDDGASYSPNDVAWPEDWRARLANGDQRLARRLDRFAEPRAVVDSLLAAENRLRGAADRRPPAEDPADLAAWRAANGVPDAPDAYDVALPDGVVLGEVDQPLVDGFLASAHEANMSNAQVSQALDWYFRQQDEIAAAQSRRDETTHQETVEELQGVWGQDFRARVNRLHAFLDEAPEGVKENLIGARMADGSLFGDCAPALLWLEQLAAAASPAATLVPAGGGGGQALADEIASIERRMAEDRTGYFKDEAMQARYRDLLAAREKRSR